MTRVRSAVFELGATPESAGDAVYRLADNVSEFTEDLYVEHAPNGAWRYLQFNGVARVVRGGSWALGSEAMSHPWSRSSMVLSGASFVGLRCVKTSLDAAMSP